MFDSAAGALGLGVEGVGNLERRGDRRDEVGVGATAGLRPPCEPGRILADELGEHDGKGIDEGAVTELWPALTGRAEELNPDLLKLLSLFGCHVISCREQLLKFFGGPDIRIGVDGLSGDLCGVGELQKHRVDAAVAGPGVGIVAGVQRTGITTAVDVIRCDQSGNAGQVG